MDRKTFLKSLALLPVVACNMKIQDFPKLTTSLPNTEKMPVLFVGHGSPMNALEDNPFTQSLKKLGEQFKKEGRKPSAILVVSAHWLTRGTFVDVSPKPKTIHDFGGFPPALYQLQYPAPPSAALAKRVAELLTAAGLPTDIDERRGLDHGAWSILVHIFPQASLPVLQLSIDGEIDARQLTRWLNQFEYVPSEALCSIVRDDLVHLLETARRYGKVAGALRTLRTTL